MTKVPQRVLRVKLEGATSPIMGFVYTISQVRLLKVYLKLLLMEHLAQGWDFSPTAGRSFPATLWQVSAYQAPYIITWGGVGCKHPFFIQK